MPRRRPLCILLSLLGLFLLGTVIVLSSVSFYLKIDPSAYLTELEVPLLDNSTRWNPKDHGQVERVPRILHQTWKTDVLPDKWVGISKACREMMPDYEYMLWTDTGSRDFIAMHYPWFLDTFDGYGYAIQRADAIRYFILYHYGGVYLDLDIGCLKPLDPLLVYPVILPKTIPVGVSNDLIFAEKGHPFLAQTIHNLATFDHSWILNYPTVMFSTGPMFLSAQYGIYTTSHPNSPGGTVRILPKSLYGKNAKKGEAPHSFFSHFYGSSWHADDAAFIGFLGTWGKGLMWVGLVVLVFGLGRMVMTAKNANGSRRSGYEVLLPRWVRRDAGGRWHFEFGRSGSRTSSSDDSDAESPIEAVSLLTYDDQSSWSSSTTEAQSLADEFAPPARTSHSMLDTLQSAVASLGGRRPSDRPRRRHRTNRSVLFFLPAIFAQPQEADLPIRQPSPPPPSYSRSTTQYPPDKQSTQNHDGYADNIEFQAGSSSHPPRSASETEG